jgi:hypothetical protein
MKNGLVILVLLAAVGWRARESSAAQYRVEPIRFPNGSPVTGTPVGINEAGAVLIGTSPAYIWDGANVVRLTDASSVWGMKGEFVAGQTAGGRAAIWRNGSLYQVFPSVGSWNMAYKVSATGVAVGWAETPGGGDVPVLWDAQSPVQLPLLGQEQGRAYGVNSSGVIAGWVGDLPNSRQIGAVWEGDSGHTVPGGSWGIDVNDQGDVVGSAYLWRHDTQQVTQLPFMALAINDRRQIVGTLGKLWEDGVTYNLSDLVDPGWTIGACRAINDVGQIVGTATFDGVSMAVRLTPIPEPGMLLSAVVCGAIVLRRRRPGAPAE